MPYLTPLADIEWEGGAAWRKESGLLTTSLIQARFFRGAVYHQQVLFQTIAARKYLMLVSCDWTTGTYFELVTIFRVSCARLESRMHSKRLLFLRQSCARILNELFRGWIGEAQPWPQDEHSWSLPQRA